MCPMSYVYVYITYTVLNIVFLDYNRRLSGIIKDPRFLVGFVLLDLYMYVL